MECSVMNVAVLSELDVEQELLIVSEVILYSWVVQIKWLILYVENLPENSVELSVIYAQIRIVRLNQRLVIP